MSDSIDDILLARYLSNECTADEIKQVKTWIEEHPDNRKYVELMKVAWETRDISGKTADVSALWKTVAQHAGITRPVQQQSIPHGTSVSAGKMDIPATQYADNYRWVKYVAILACIVILPYLVTMAVRYFTPSSNVNDFYVDNGKSATLTLLDGTKIMLDSGSRLKYPDEFEGNTRDVYLEGEGFFEVKKDLARPFIIHAGKARVQVLGTKFNVRAWKQDSSVTVMVSEGKVSLRRDDVSDSVNTVVIQQGQFSMLMDDGTLSQPKMADANKYLAWTQNEIYFKDAPLQDVFSQLERWYDVTFEVNDADIINERVNMHVQKKSIDDILELLFMLTQLHVKREGKVIRLTGENF